MAPTLAEGRAPSPAPVAAAPLQLLLVGVGGQGVLTAARVLGEAAHAAGCDVVVGQLHGMSQRGGPVECTVRLSAGAGSFLVGAADLMAAFEPLEMLRALRGRLPPRRILLSDTPIVPYALAVEGADYPALEDVVAEARRVTDDVRTFPGSEIVRRLGDVRVLNTAVLGAIAGMGLLPFDRGALTAAASRRLPGRFVEINERAFELGHDWATRGRTDSD